MASGLLHRFRLKRAARRYVLALGPRLLHDFGASEFYTPRQIDAAVARLQLDRKYIVLAYSAFLPKTLFEELAANLPMRMGYEETQALYERFVPAVASGSTVNAGADIDVQSMGLPPT